MARSGSDAAEPAKRKASVESSSGAEDETSPAKRLKHEYSTDFITVVVGESEKEFGVHKSILCKTSKFFQIACSRDWKEGQDKLIKLPEADIEAFKVYAHWLYSGDIKTTLMTAPKWTHDHPSFQNLGSLWILGNFLDDITFTNQMIDCFLLKLDRLKRTYISGSLLNNLWKLTPPQSGLRRLVFRLTLARIQARNLDQDREPLSPEILVEIARRHVAGDPKETCPTFMNRCEYHTHREGEEKCK